MNPLQHKNKVKGRLPQLKPRLLKPLFYRLLKMRKRAKREIEKRVPLPLDQQNNPEIRGRD